MPAQKISRGNLSTIAEDTSTYPHDFNDDYYIKNGVSPKFIIERRTGTDYLSVFGLTSDPRHRSVRVLVTLPAYGQNGEMLFWTPLGELREDGFTEDGIGMQAREAANTYPIYVFPKFSDPSLFAFTNVRQSALIDRTQEGLLPEPYSNVLGVRVIVLVNYTEKAFNTKEGVQMMQYMAKKNGLSLEGTPLIKTKSDLDELAKYECISMQKRVFWDDSPYRGIYAISPIIIEPVKQAIAGDAFLFMVTKDGKPLDSESAFAAQFACLQKTGEWCSE
ncbi:MAG TPA: hypothetical protein VNB22_08015 [Pyrinomonadaceae bacterium]|nr:hypothetical protein [Pyrinomonadaceae bacterium]